MLLVDVDASQQGHLECFVKLMTTSTVGQRLDANPKARMYMDAYFARITAVSKNMSIDSQIRLMLQASLCICFVRQLLLDDSQAGAD